MMTYHIYQPTINDDRYFEVNAEGWGGVEWGRAYLKATTLAGEACEAFDAIRAAVEHDLYQHNWTIRALTVEHTFDITNGMAGDLTTRNSVRFRREGAAKSGSVGDVAIAADGSYGWICLPFGWAEMSEEAIRWFQSKVATQDEETFGAPDYANDPDVSWGPNIWNR